MVTKDQIEEILKKHSFTQNSFIDEDGENHWNLAIEELYKLMADEILDEQYG